MQIGSSVSVSSLSCMISSRVWPGRDAYDYLAAVPARFVCCLLSALFSAPNTREPLSSVLSSQRPCYLNRSILILDAPLSSGADKDVDYE